VLAQNYSIFLFINMSFPGHTEGKKENPLAAYWLSGLGLTTQTKNERHNVILVKK
jgi:hypothetical protein